MSMHSPDCMCLQCRPDLNRFIKSLSPEDQRIWNCICLDKCPGCGGKKREGWPCEACGFRYPDQEKKP